MDDITELLNDINVLFKRKQNINELLNIISPTTIFNPLIKQMIEKREIKTVEENYLTVGIQTKIPLAYLENSKYKGIDVDIIEKYAKILNLQIKYIQVNDLKQNTNIDVFVGGRTKIHVVSIEGTKKHIFIKIEGIEWSMPYFYAENCPNIIVNLPNDTEFVFATKLGSGIASSLSTFTTALIYENKLENILLNYGLQYIPILNIVEDKMFKNIKINTIKQKKLVVATYTEFPPIAFYDKNNVLTGIDVDIISLYAKFCGLEIEWKNIPKFDGIWNLPENKVSDISIGGIANTLGRGTELTEWSMPYFYVHRSMIYSKNNRIFNNIIRGTENSTGWLDSKQQQKANNPNNIFAKKIMGANKLEVSQNTNKEDIKDLINGKIMGLMRGDFVARSNVKEHPNDLAYFRWNMDETLLPTDGEIFAFPAKLGSNIAPSISSFITYLIYEGKLKKLLLKYNLIDESDINTYYKPISTEEVIKEQLSIPKHLMEGRYKRLCTEFGKLRENTDIVSLTQQNYILYMELISGCLLMIDIPIEFPLKDLEITIENRNNKNAIENIMKNIKKLEGKIETYTHTFSILYPLANAYKTREFNIIIKTQNNDKIIFSIHWDPSLRLTHFVSSLAKILN